MSGCKISFFALSLSLSIQGKGEGGSALFFPICCELLPFSLRGQGKEEEEKATPCVGGYHFYLSLFILLFVDFKSLSFAIMSRWVLHFLVK